MKTMINEYHSFLLRIWISGTCDEKNIRATLEDPFSHSIKGFSSMEALFMYLIGLTKSDKDVGTMGEHNC
jgi:hypothetical protein